MAKPKKQKTSKKAKTDAASDGQKAREETSDDLVKGAAIIHVSDDDYAFITLSYPRDRLRPEDVIDRLVQGPERLRDMALKAHRIIFIDDDNRMWLVKDRWDIGPQPRCLSVILTSRQFAVPYPTRPGEPPPGYSPRPKKLPTVH